MAVESAAVFTRRGEQQRELLDSRVRGSGAGAGGVAHGSKALLRHSAIRWARLKTWATGRSRAADSHNTAVLQQDIWTLLDKDTTKTF